MILITTLLSLLNALAPSAYADPCLAIQGIKSEAEYYALLKVIVPTPAQFDVLQTCWKNRDLPRPLLDVPNSMVLASLQTELGYYPTTELRSNAFHALFDLDTEVGNLTERANRIHMEQVAPSIRTYIPKGKVGMYTGVSELFLNLMKNNPIQVQLKESTIKVFETGPRPQPFVKKIVDAYNLACLRRFEDIIVTEYIHNPNFTELPSKIGGMAGNLPGFTHARISEIIDRELPKLTQNQQNEFIARVVRFNDEFNRILNSSYAMKIIDSLNFARESITPREMNQLLTKLDYAYGTSYRRSDYKDLYHKLLPLLKIEAIHRSQPAGLNLLMGKDQKKALHEIDLFLLKRKAIYPSSEVLTQEMLPWFDLEQLEKDPFGACKNLLHGLPEN